MAEAEAEAKKEGAPVDGVGRLCGKVEAPLLLDEDLLAPKGETSIEDEDPVDLSTVLVLDLEMVLFAFDGLTQDAVAFLRLASKQLQQRLQALQGAAIAGMLPEMEALSHSAKGVAYSIGAQRLGTVLASVEKLARQGRVNPRQLARLSPTLAELDAAIGTLQSDLAAEAATASPVSAGEGATA